MATVANGSEPTTCPGCGHISTVLEGLTPDESAYVVTCSRCDHRAEIPRGAQTGVPVVHLVVYAWQPYVSLRCEDGCKRLVYAGACDSLGEGVFRTEDGALYTFARERVTCPECVRAEDLVTTVTIG